MELMTRDKFREAVFKRDGHMCVICHQPAADAHHIIERRLFSDGGYYIDNGASLCPEHHIKAEETTLSCEEIRTAAGITKIIIPEHLYDDQEYDKWGNIIQPNGTRLKGDLFEDESVQKIIAPVLHEFSKYIKYPRTYHVTWSNLLKDDRMLESDDIFEDEEVIASIKMDGECSTLYNDYTHARSLDSGSHETRNWLKGYWSRFNYQISEGMRICGENLYAQHCIHYDNLRTYFQVFSIWYNMTCLSWDETLEYSMLLDLDVVPVIYRGVYDKDKIIQAFKDYETNVGRAEGYVIRLAGEFKYGDFRRSVAKYVNPEFREMVNNTHGHWISQKIVPNSLKQ